MWQMDGFRTVATVDRPMLRVDRPMPRFRLTSPSNSVSGILSAEILSAEFGGLSMVT